MKTTQVANLLLEEPQLSEQLQLLAPPLHSALVLHLVPLRPLDHQVDSELQLPQVLEVSPRLVVRHLAVDLCLELVLDQCLVVAQGEGCHLVALQLLVVEEFSAVTAKDLIS